MAKTVKSPLCEMLGITYPIFQGGMAWVAKGRLAAAVSEGGGLGIIAASQAPAEYVREQIHILKSLTDKPFGVNIMMQSPYVKEIAELVIEEKVPVLTTGAGNPTPYMEAWKAAGIKVFPVIPNVKVAKKMAAAGAAGLVAEGMESGGHIGEMTSMALLPQVLDAVDIPVLAAGGFADGRGLAAALLMGAAGVQMGTAFLVAEECDIAQGYKDKVVAAQDTDTVITGRSTSHVVRSIKNQMTARYLEVEGSCAENKMEQLEKLGAGALRRATEGDIEMGALMAGQIAGLVKEEAPAAVIIERIMDDVVKVLKKAQNLL